MPATMKAFGLDRLSVEDRIELAREIWDSVEREIEGSPLTDAQRVELERRLADSIARPDAVIPWEEVKAQALARAQR
jgi:putative addiction module component (TIGR02574 family)